MKKNIWNWRSFVLGAAAGGAFVAILWAIQNSRV